MSHQRQRSFAMSLLLMGLLVTLMSFGGGWGAAYGQTAGPTPTPRRATLSISKEVDNPRPRPGETVVFTIRVQNIGDQPTRNVVVQDVMPSAFEVLDATSSAGTVSVRGPTVRVEIPQIDPGASVVVTIRARLRPDARGRLVNTVIVRENNAEVGEQRAEAILEIADEAGEDGQSDTSPDAPGTGAQGPRGSLGNTGADSSTQWWLLLLGLMLMAAGSAIFWRSRSAR
jgi:uncharacterized repeat protein (TIGR01451 family)/LPXTG-motif cell wall-anchored protein